MRRKVRKRILQPTVTTVQLVPKHNNQNETKSNIKKTQISKLSFRTKALDPSKPMNIHIGEELPGLRGCSVINRAVPLLPTGMNKGEESVRRLVFLKSNTSSTNNIQSEKEKQLNKFSKRALYQEIKKQLLKIDPIFDAKLSNRMHQYSNLFFLVYTQ